MCEYAPPPASGCSAALNWSGGVSPTPDRIGPPRAPGDRSE
jgi:hypothetical protein